MTRSAPFLRARARPTHEIQCKSISITQRSFKTCKHFFAIPEIEVRLLRAMRDIRRSKFFTLPIRTILAILKILAIFTDETIEPCRNTSSKGKHATRSM